MSNKLSPYNYENTQLEKSGEDGFWKEYYPKLQRYCHFLTQNPWDGDDIAQETFLKALKYSFPQQKITTALLNKIAYHHWVDLLRKRKNESIESDPATQELMNQSDDIANSVELLLKQFTPKQAVIFLLKEAFQYKTKEIAVILNTTEVAIKSNLHRAKNRLEKEAFSVASFWDDDEREKLSDLFYESLKNQDPTVLIESIPSIKSVMEVPKLVSKTYSPSSTLCMAA